MNKISVIIPCYYNEENIPYTSAALLENEQLFPEDVSFEYIMVDDGSKDGTYDALRKFKSDYPDKVKIVKLAGNFGAYTAVLAGMKYATGDCNIVIAADLQDPPELMVKMYDYWSKGTKLVLANRANREDALFDKMFAKWYHRLIKKYAIGNMPDGGFDFCLFDAKLREEVVAMNEKNTNTLFLLVWLKYDFVSIPYTRVKRKIGTSKWTFKKKIKLLIDSFAAFSYFPIRIISLTGMLLGIAAIVYAIFILIAKLTGHIQIEGWTAMMLIFLFVSAFQMIAIGILGEYLWRTLDAARNRPTYVVSDVE